MTDEKTICRHCETELDRKNSNLFMSGPKHHLEECRQVLLDKLAKQDAKLNEVDQARRNASMAVVLAQEIIAKHEATIEKFRPIVVSVGLAPCPFFLRGEPKCGVCLQCQAHAALAPKTAAEYYLPETSKP
jgi:hypothetical protein